jgi:hypothetical protein
LSGLSLLLVEKLLGTGQTASLDATCWGSFGSAAGTVFAGHIGNGRDGLRGDIWGY